MAVEEALACISVPASADLSASQYCFVRIDSNGRAALPLFSGDGVGILQNKPSALGAAATIATRGRSKFAGGGNVSLGNEVTSVALTGKGVAVTTDTKVLGVCLDAATSTTLGSVLLDARR